jgi:AcrR family transcriptional regulator
MSAPTRTTSPTPSPTTHPDPDLDLHRAPGRPRNPEVDRAIRRAALDLLAEESYDGLSIEAVAARAGCGKAAIYRRWPSKAALVVDAVGACKDQGFQLPDTGSTREDLLRYVENMVRFLRTSDVGRIMPAMLAELARNPEFAASYRQELVQPRRALVRVMLQRGVDRGELRPDVDLDIVADAMASVFHYRLFFNGQEIDEGMPERVVDLLWRGVAVEA